MIKDVPLGGVWVNISDNVSETKLLQLISNLLNITATELIDEKDTHIDVSKLQDGGNRFSVF